jgi:hypothetical protein
MDSRIQIRIHTKMSWIRNTLVREWERRMEDARAVGCEYSDTVLAHKLLAGARLHQATRALIGQCRKNIKTQSWHISFWRGPGSIRQHTLSLVNAGKYSDTVLAHKLLAGARLHQATHAFTPTKRQVSKRQVLKLKTSGFITSETSGLQNGRSSKLSDAKTSGFRTDTELAHNQSISAQGGDVRHQCWHTSFGRVRLH